MKEIKRIIKYMFSKPVRKRYDDKSVIAENKTKKLPDSDYDGMGNFSRFGKPPG